MTQITQLGDYTDTYEPQITQISQTSIKKVTQTSVKKGKNDTDVDGGERREHGLHRRSWPQILATDDTDHTDWDDAEAWVSIASAWTRTARPPGAL